MADVKIDVSSLSFNPYECLDITNEESTEKQIIKAFRKKALQWHPDKNPDRLELANSMFQKIQKALEILCDKPARGAYDRLLKARKAAAVRHSELNEKRRKLREDLEAREKGARSQQEEEIYAAQKFEQEIDRLRKEGSSLLQKERENIEREIHKNDSKQPHKPQTFSISDPKFVPRLKLKWKATRADLAANNGGYSEEILRDIALKYGQIHAFVMSKKGGSALLEFAEISEAKNMFDSEKGLDNNPFVCNWVEEPPKINVHVNNNANVNVNCGVNFAGLSNYSNSGATDFESVVLMKMRQAQERKTLMEDMKNEESL